MFCSQETRAELETAAAEAGEDLSDDSLDDGMDDLDDVDLVSPGWRSLGDRIVTLWIPRTDRRAQG